MLWKTARVYRCGLNVVASFCLLCFSQSVYAGIEWSGDVDPDDPTTWTSRTDSYIGKDGIGTLDITAGGTVSNGSGFIGYGSGAIGEVSVDGAGSTWYLYPGFETYNEGLYVGREGSGTLNISNGGAVTVVKETWVAGYEGSTGTIHFDGGTLTTGGFYCAANDLTGTGTITTNGLVTDIELVFDATHGLNQTINIKCNPEQNITVNLSVESPRLMGIGYCGIGTMSISDGIVVESTHGIIGYKSGSMGEVTLDGFGSMWTNSGILYIGGAYIAHGSGTLNVTNGSMVSNYIGTIGHSFGSTGEATVDGSGSIWISDYFLGVGEYGSGNLTIQNGGLVCVGENITIDYDEDGDSFINMDTGGMLALHGEGDNSLADFLDMIDGTDAIRYWDDSISGWANILGATRGEDYTLSCVVGGELDGYTVLCVGAPEPGVAGDVNHDGVVDETDAAVLAKYWLTESGAIWGMGDFNGDGAVNEIDATLLAANLQSGSGEQSVPEPSVFWGLLGWFVGGIWGWGRFGLRS